MEKLIWQNAKSYFECFVEKKSYKFHIKLFKKVGDIFQKKYICCNCSKFPLKSSGIFSKLNSSPYLIILSFFKTSIMNTNKVLVTGLIGGVFAFFFGWLFYGILFKDLMPNNVPGLMKPESEMVMWAMIVSNLVFGIFLAYIFVRMGDVTTWLSGAREGAIFGLLYAVSLDLGFYSMSNMHTMNSMLADIAMNTVFNAVVGALLGWWLGRK